MSPAILLTIDTELVWRHHAAGLDAVTVVRRSIDPARVGLAYQLRMLAEHRLKACFFVDPMPALVLGIDVIRTIVERILAAGQEVQLHLHPNWAAATLADRTAAAWFELADYAFAAQRALIEQARDLLVRAGAPPPIAFRAGSFAANDDTLRALASLGFRFDSSHNGSQAPWPCAVGLPRAQIAPVTHQGVIEVPVTVFEDRPGSLRHCQFTAISASELNGAIDHAIGAAHPLMTVFGHTFELASRDGRHPNRILARRFEAMCRSLASRETVAPTTFFRELDPALGATATPMPARLGRTAARMTAQIASNLIYERRP